MFFILLALQFDIINDIRRKSWIMQAGYAFSLFCLIKGLLYIVDNHYTYPYKSIKIESAGWMWVKDASASGLGTHKVLDNRFTWLALAYGCGLGTACLGPGLPGCAGKEG